MNAKCAFVFMILTSVLLQSSPSEAHEQWPDGSTVSEQIKRRCCGQAEIHFLPPGSVHARPDGWHIEGFGKVVPFGTEAPSPDGNNWGFWAEHRYDGFKVVGGQSEMMCLFLNEQTS